MIIKKYWMMIALALVSLCAISCGGDDDDGPSNTSTKPNNSANGTEQKVQVGHTDQFYLGNTLCDWTDFTDYTKSCISSVSSKLFFYITNEKVISKSKLPDVSVKLWRNRVGHDDIFEKWCIVAVEKSGESYDYYCIYTDDITDSGARILGWELTICRIM